MSNLNMSLVSVEWLYNNLDLPNLVVLDGTIPKVTEQGLESDTIQIPNARFFDIKKKFSDVAAPFPNTVPSEEQFNLEARELGINTNSIIIVYDDKGIYSSARVWYLFKAFGHKQVAVLDGGLPEWVAKGYAVEEKKTGTYSLGNFHGTYYPDYFKFFDDIQNLKEDNSCTILDARSSERFNGTVAEPRAGLRSGNIPGSESLPFKQLMDGYCMKPVEELKHIFASFQLEDNTLICSCGSGITACIIALAYTLTGNTNMSVYDGSWTEYGTLTDA